MALTLNHYSIRTTDMTATRDFYERVLQLTVGPRPDFPFPGLWMYRGDHADVANAVVHIIGMDANDPEGLKAYLGDRDVSTLKGSGALDHVAFFADGLAGMLAHLKEVGVPARERTVPAIGLHQLFLDDPNGVVVELNYPAAEKQALGH
jgi:catechol 2,3-dioxygenase-like lactoylglutathione lyase family enzyme